MQIGQTIGNYRLVERLGEGGIGVVFGAHHVQLTRRAAIKILRPEFSADPDMVARFFNEAQSVNVVQHPGIVSIFEFGRLPDGTAYIVMEFLGGETLSRRMREAAPRLGLLGLRLVRQMASALAAVHARGIVHRDLKPDNVMIVPDSDVLGGERSKILDFGIAKVAGGLGPTGAQLNVTRSGQMMGTPFYMSPEQFRDAATVTDRADVYSLGIMLYEVLSGKPPFIGHGLADMAGMHLFSEPRPLPEAELGLPEGLSALVSRMLAKDPGARPSMAEVSSALGAFLGGGTSDASTQSFTAPLASSSTPPVGPTGAPLTGPGAKEQTLPLTQPVAGPGASAGPTAAAATGATGSGGPTTAPATQATAGRGRFLLPALLGVGALALAGTALHLTRRPPVAVVTPAPVAPPTPPAPPPAPDLAQLREQALAVLKEGLRESDAGLRRRAVATLLLGREPRYGALAAPLLTDREPEVQAQAVLAVQRLGDRAATKALAALLDDRSAPEEVRVQAAGALWLLSDAHGERLLRDALRSRDEHVRLRAARWLAEHGDRRALRLVLGQEALDDEQAETLGRLFRRGEGEAGDALRRFLPPTHAADEWTVRAAEELARGEDVPARAVLDELAGADGPLRLRAARTLAGLDEPSFYDLLLGAFRNAKAAVGERVLAAEGLGALARKDSAPPLAAVLPREAGAALRLRMAAAGAILHIAALDPYLLGSDSLDVVALNLKGSDDEREHAAASLGDADPGAGLPLLSEAIRDAAPAVRQSAAQALGRTRVRAAVPVLGAALSDQVDGVRRAALRSVGEVGQHLRRKGEAVDDVVRLVAAQKDAARGPAEQVARVATLLRLGDEGHRAELTPFLGSSDPQVRREAISAWATEQAQKDELLTALRDSDAAVRLAAAGALAERGDPSGVPVLERALSQKGEAGVLARGHLLHLGREVKGPVPMPSGPEPQRVAMVAASAKLPVSETLAVLRQAAQDLAVAVRLQVVQVLGDLPALLVQAAGRRLLGTMLGDPDVLVRSRAGLLSARRALSAPERSAPEPRPTTPTAPPAEPPPTGAAPTAPEEHGQPAQKGQLIIEAEEGVRYQLDRRPQQAGPRPAFSVSSGRHKLSYEGGVVDVEVPAGETVSARVPLTAAEQALLDAEAALAAGDVERAGTLLGKARGRVKGERLFTLLLTQARVYEAEGRTLEAMNELDGLKRKIPDGSRSAAQRAAVGALFAKLSPNLGQVRVSKEVDGSCQKTEFWALPGVHFVDVGGERREVRVRAGEVLEVATCK